MRKAQKKVAEENLQKAVKLATEMAETAVSDGKPFCVSRVEVGLDAAAVREAVLKVIEQKVWIVIFCFHLNFCLLCTSAEGNYTGAGVY